MAAGTIKKVVADRGFGFITSDDEKDYFFHRSSLDSSLDFDRLEGGEKVEFEIEQSDKGHEPPEFKPPNNGDDTSGDEAVRSYAGGFLVARMM